MSDKHLTPVIFLVFSNSKDDYLKNLIEEEKDILKSLQDHDDQGHIQVHRVAHTEIKDIFDDVNRYSERIAIFHYAGHAGDTYLQLQDDAGEEKKASVKGLAQLLGRQPALQLVFLNGCATRGWIERLFEAGVKAVIATTVKIDDRQATDFAEQFYRALATGKQGIKNAFETAKNFLESDAAHQGEIGIHDMAEATRGGNRKAQEK
ncbi:MAG: CHAT domain-containing protein, partial [Calditrichaeota bacterium]|nr:CHAT domain-containing protein [Calditrichota bacterium]